MFVIVGLIATLAIFGVWRGRSLWVRALVGTIVIALIWFFWNPMIRARGGSEWWQQALWRNLILYASMLMGMMFRVIWDSLELWRQHNAQAGARRKRRPRFEFWEFVYPIMPSLVVFQAVLLFADKEELSLPLLLASFQNGFFWNAVLSRTKQSIGASER
jgi:hypothetical protein